MLPGDIHLTFEDGAAHEIQLTNVSVPEVVVVASTMGPQGPQGPEGQWLALTQAGVIALTPPDPETLYVIIP